MAICFFFLQANEAGVAEYEASRGVYNYYWLQIHSYFAGGAVPYNPLTAAAAMFPQLASNIAPQEVTWMPLPAEIPPACPPGLEYLVQIDQILVHQQIELFESEFLLLWLILNWHSCIDILLHSVVLYC